MKNQYPNYQSSQLQSAIPILVFTADELSQWLKKQKQFIRNWVKCEDFNAEPGSFCLLADYKGNLEKVLVGFDGKPTIWTLADLPYKLPLGKYYIETVFEDQLLQQMVIGWGLGAYRFSHYKKSERKACSLITPKCCNQKSIKNILESIYMGRDLINMPAEDLGPSELADVTFQLGKKYHAMVDQIADQELLRKGFHAIYHVGKASRPSQRAPRLIDLQWGEVSHPAVTLVGKGVCFDSGGLNLKPSSAMQLMKKDMGGAAHALSLARMIIEDGLPIRLRVLIPAIDNVIDGCAYRPGDVLKMRNGKTVEIGDTDAEGRLIVGDALVEASNGRPKLLIDFTTLTGAARVALGTEIPAMFSNNTKLAQQIQAFSELEQDPIWLLPLYQPYRQLLASNVADMNNVGKSGYGGAITAALFLQEFVSDKIDWLHFDMSAWNYDAKPGCPQGGELMGLRALFSYIRQRFSVRH